MIRPAASRAALAALLLLLAASPPARGAPPPQGTCPTLPAGAGKGAEGGEPGGPVLHEGMKLGVDDILALRSLFPPEVWQHREVFFFEGMRLEVGPCHRRYPVPDFYAKATRDHAGEARLDGDGNLRGYRAGLPFPVDAIDPHAADAGARWAWDLEERYRGAGPGVSFRLTDLPSRLGSVETYLGSFFWLLTGHRADLEASGYAVPEADDTVWVAGGQFDEPFYARHLAWRQLRPVSTERKFSESDRTWVYVPDMRKPRRAATAWVDGLFTPRYSSSGQIAAGGGVPFGEGGQVAAINPTSGISAAASQDMRRGFVGLVLRPNAYVWTYRGEHDVLAPLNSSHPGYPTDPERNFGPTGLSVADDSWDVRRAVVIEGQLKRPDRNVAGVTLYIDYQTQQPLYYISHRSNGLVLDVGILVHRFSGDLPEYPEWPGGGRALVFDPVAAAFFTVAEGGTGWRRESYDVVSVPVDASKRRRMMSVAELNHGR